jgi:hypothetical protein
MFVCQGDVGIKKINKLPEGLKEVPADNGRNILAYGERTGHAHALPTQSTRLYSTNDNSRLYLVVNSLSHVTHEEHDPINLDAGVYEIIQQREYDDEKEWRQVAD